MRTIAGILVGVLGTAAGPAALGAGGGNVTFPRFPSISPDGKTIAFSWRGDVWSAPSTGGTCTRLTSHPSNDLRTAWSPDGTSIAFNSSRLGGLNVFVMSADGSNVRAVTQSDRPNTISGFTSGGTEVLFSAARESDNYRAARPYRVPVTGGATERLMDCFGENPQTSPDGSKIVFERGGSEWSRRNYRGPDSRDLWMYDVAARSFSRLTTWPGNDGKARWQNNSTLVFLSDRELETVNVWAMTLDGGESKARRLTSFEGNDVHDFDVALGSGTCVLSAWDSLYTLNLRDSSPAAKPLTLIAAEDEADNFVLKQVGKDVTAAALNPDGKSMAVIAYGQIYVRSTDEKSPTRRVTSGTGRCREIAWSPDGTKLYFSSDEDGSDGLYVVGVERTRDELKENFKKSVTPAAPGSGPEKKPEPEGAAPPPVNPEPAPSATPAAVATAGEAQANPPSGPDATSKVEPPVATAPAPEPKKDEPDYAKLAERWAKAVRFSIEPLKTGRSGGIGGTNERLPAPSPDGKSIAFRRGRGDVMIMDLASGQVRRLIESWDYGNEFRWSPDSRFIAYAGSDDNFNSDVWIARADGSAPPVNITRHPDVDGAPRWSADGRVLALLSEREGDFDVFAVYLDKDLESMNSMDLEKYYKDAADAAKKRKPLNHEKKKGDKKDDKKGDDDTKPDSDKEKKPEAPFEPALNDAFLRLRRITSMSGAESNLEITPGGDRLIFTGNDKGDGGEGLYSIKWTGDEKERKRLTDGEPKVQGVSLSGDKVVLVDKGSAAMIGPEGGKTDSQAIEDRVRLDLKAQATQKFTEGARVLGEVFYHPTMKGLDWKKVSERYLALAKQTRTIEEFAYVGMRLVGELNASHLGFYPPPEQAALGETVGRLGIDVVAANAPERVFLVRAVVPRGPASIGPMAIKPGDQITQIDFEPFTEHDSLENRLRGKVGKEVAVTFKRQLAEGAPRIELSGLFTPVSYERDTDYRYDWWVAENARKVGEWSSGKIGYLHIRGMSEPSLVDFERDLYAAANGKAGLLVDVRNNGGGWTADRVLASLVSPAHAYTVPRGGTPNTDAYPRDRLFIQRYTKPVNMLCNEKSFSNAEIISHAFKHLKRGNLCGQQTYGGVISTDGTNLIDGTLVRLPFRGWYTFEGKDMENNGAVPDILTVQTPEDESSGTDSQLQRATEDLLKRVQ